MTILIRRRQLNEAVYDGSDGTAAPAGSIVYCAVVRSRSAPAPGGSPARDLDDWSTRNAHQLGSGFVPSAHRTRRSHRLGLLTTTWTVLSTILRVWIVRSRQRRALSRMLDDRDLLKDIGVSQEEALHEAEKSFWRR